MIAYYRTFNSGDHTRLADYYSEDVVFEYGDVRLQGRKVVLDYLAGLQQGFEEKIHPLSMVVDGNKIAVEVQDTFTAKVDLPDFLGRPLKQGESVTARYGGFYDTREDKICHIRLYSSSK